MKMRGDVERQRNNKGRHPYSTVNESDFVWAPVKPTQAQVLTAGHAVKVETHNYLDEPVFIPTFQVKRRNKKARPIPIQPKHMWSL